MTIVRRNGDTDGIRWLVEEFLLGSGWKGLTWDHRLQERALS